MLLFLSTFLRIGAGVSPQNLLLEMLREPIDAIVLTPAEGPAPDRAERASGRDVGCRPAAFALNPSFKTTKRATYLKSRFCLETEMKVRLRERRSQPPAIGDDFWSDSATAPARAVWRNPRSH
jgi:hypothetical protein